MQESALVSVIIPLYNAEQYIYEAVNSIINQTYQNIEIIIIDDGSTDASEKTVSSLNSPKILYVKNEKNLGVSATRNRGFEIAKGKYISLMDADDVSISTRLEKQVYFLEKHSDYGVVSSHYESFRKHPFGVKTRIRKLPIDTNSIHANLLFTNVVCGAVTTIRSSVLKNNHLKFDTSLQMAEDFDLWRRLSFVTKIANIDEVLLRYRKHANNSIKNRIVLDRDFTKVIQKSFEYFNLNIQDLFNEEYKLKDIESFLLLHQHLELILEQNIQDNRYEQYYLKQASVTLLQWMFKKHIDTLGYGLYQAFSKLSLYNSTILSRKEKIQYYLKYKLGKI